MSIGNLKKAGFYPSEDSDRSASGGEVEKA